MPKPASSSKAVLSGVIQPVRIGFIALTDCAPLLVARDHELFRKHGVRVELSCEVGWATIREKLLYGQVDAAHAIAGLALAMRMGISTPPCRVVAPFVFNLHGNAITLSRDLWNRGVRDAASLKKLIRSSSSRRFTFGVVSRCSSHNFLLRRWLVAGGIDVDKEVRIVVLPPTQMASNLTAGLVDGCCVGEPWSSAAVERGIGWIAATSEELAPGHPEKVLLTTESFIERHADEALAITAALKEACVFCDVKENRAEVARILVKSGYFSVSEEILKRSLVGPLDLGTGAKAAVDGFHVFHRRDANEPTSERGRWLLEEFIAHGLLQPSQRAEGADALRECWSSSILTFPKAQAAAPKTTKSKNRSKLILA
ncbi:CmpA/NrtA family ABC transporter substrate-binding protein [Prosthecobacter sp.]|uniref:CmpA/NrtA family ABC transporter substrate-binding protein n=1 Tax=Prosthecobacter sp. TaxID=1965333 RepID=UPI001DACEDE4|nr:CmpA/NrtA family ABC transporter substrate-binding protein [Prosthecobacter sp.]MCB1275606.1 ABC transporter substrate-binding protein [Prosthecobacter sp.]